MVEWPEWHQEVINQQETKEADPKLRKISATDVRVMDTGRMNVQTRRKGSVMAEMAQWAMLNPEKEEESGKEDADQDDSNDWVGCAELNSGNSKGQA